MIKCLAALFACLLLTGCTAPEPSGGPPAAQSAGDADDIHVTVLSIPLAEQTPYQPWESMEADTVSAGTMGEVLCGKTLPDGTEVVCYWEPDHLTNPEHEFTKYWAIRQGDELLRFAQEYSAYASGYDVTPFTGILGQNGFRIQAPRGAAYEAFDYYIIDENGVPRMLADCANHVLEADVNGDGVTELLWFYHGFHEIYYYALLDGKVCMLPVSDVIADASPIDFCGADLSAASEDTAALSGRTVLPVTYLPCGGTCRGEGTVSPALPAQLRFTRKAVEFQVPEGCLWTMDCYALMDGVLCVRRFDSGWTDWTPLGPAIPAPASWAGQDLAGRNRAKDWAGIEPAFTSLEMVSAGDGWLMLSLESGVAGMDTYIYRTHDGGQTWAEAAPLPEEAWLPAQAAFLDDSHAVITTKVFDGAPVYTTADGGQTWTEAVLPLPEGGALWRPEALQLEGGAVYLSMGTNTDPGHTSVITLCSADQGQSWVLLEGP
ncbi:hypothetical protein [uncultured Dysosmobacter sp.]|uniref:WD40/YVTN/BNR-like repeat-containing protein n=1 Tax=uncultured Dysosmobacter sp. TaxID=2591384 RepID=UPI0026197B51|nr:hypothetical protein [uncultured Dysosmobacter sp.]